MKTRRSFSIKNFKSTASVCFLAMILAAACSVISGIRSAECNETKQGVFHSEQFLSLKDWKPVFFPKIARHSTYTPVVVSGGPALEAKSDNSASAIRLTSEYDIYKFPKLSWSWKISNVYDKGDPTKKSGDDYPIRVYVMFRYNPANAAAWQKLKYGAAKKLYGEYPPHSAILYIWASKPGPHRIITNPYAQNAKMVALEAGKSRIGQWIDESVDVLSDYREAFGKDPPAEATLAVMNDSDNTQESSASWLRDLVIHK